TLALFTEATLYTMAIPEHRSAALLLFGSLDQAISATQRILPMDPSACDLLDRRLLSLGRQADPRFRDMISPDAEAGLVVEFTAGSARDAMLRLQDLQLLLRSEQIDFRCSRTAVDYDDVELLWRLPAQIVSVLASLRGDSRPLPFVEDVAVPPDQLAEFLVRAQRVFQKHEVTATLYAHAASGQLHFRPILPVPSRGDATLLMNIASDLYSEVARVQGTISGEHGDGISRTPWISSQYGPLVSVFRNVKKLLDPLNLMNPDKIISNDPQPLTGFLRETRLHQAAAESAPALLPVMQFAESSTLREQLYKAHVTRASDQSPEDTRHLDNSALIQEILALRQEEARLLGFDNYAQVSVVPKMAESPEKVTAFLRDLATKARPFAEKDL
ncbi:MAG: FAD-linked oxidase C-terminal domain-containing protein, partial [Planctomycetaceae bacterium]